MREGRKGTTSVNYYIILGWIHTGFKLEVYSAPPDSRQEGSSLRHVIQEGKGSTVPMTGGGWLHPLPRLVLRTAFFWVVHTQLSATFLLLPP